MNKIEAKCLDRDVILFGPFIGEFGWELMRWCGFVRYFKNKYQEKKVYVCSRNSSRDLYEGIVDGFYGFDLEGDYSKKLMPLCYDIPNMDTMDYLTVRVKFVSWVESSEQFTMIEPCELKYDKSIFYDLWNEQDFNFTPRQENKAVIDEITKDLDKFVVVFPRNRKDSPQRNWGSQNWESFFNVLNNKGINFVVAGNENNSYLPNSGIKLADYIDIENVSMVGLTIEAIKKAELTIGSQSAGVVLSNLIGTPTLFFGNEISRIAQHENPFNTPCYFVDAPKCCAYRIDVKRLTDKLFEIL